MSHPSAPGEVQPTRVRWTIFSLAFLTSAILYLHRYVFGFIKPALQQEYALTNEQLGQIDGAFAAAYAILQFPLGIAADLAGVHLVLVVLMVVWSGGLSLTATATTASGLWYAQTILGAGQSAVYACLNRLSRMWYPPALRTTLQGAVGVLAGRLGALGASLVFTTVLLGYFELPWRTAVWILVAIGGALLAAFALLFRNDPRHHPRVNEAEARLIAGPGTLPSRGPESAPSVSTKGSPLAADAPGSERVGPSATALSEASVQTTSGSWTRGLSVAAACNLFWLALQSILSTFADNVYSNWVPKFLFDVHHLEYKQMGIYSSLPLLGGAIGGLMGGALNDYFIARTGNRRWSRVGVALVGKGMAGLLLGGALWGLYDHPTAFCASLFFVKLFSDWSLTTSLGVVTDIGGRATASVFAFNNAVAGIGFVTAPLAFGYLADHYSWQAVFVAVTVAYFLCAASWLGINCLVPVLRESR